jgi:hypothetical protein
MNICDLRPFLRPACSKLFQRTMRTSWLSPASAAFLTLLLVLPVAIVLSFSPAPSKVENGTPKLVEHEKDLLQDLNTGVGFFAWSPDSRRIAFVKWRAGEVAIVDNAGDTVYRMEPRRSPARHQ